MADPRTNAKEIPNLLCRLNLALGEAVHLMAAAYRPASLLWTTSGSPCRSKSRTNAS